MNTWYLSFGSLNVGERFRFFYRLYYVFYVCEAVRSALPL